MEHIVRHQEWMIKLYYSRWATKAQYGVLKSSVEWRSQGLAHRTTPGHLSLQTLQALPRDVPSHVSTHSALPCSLLPELAYGDPFCAQSFFFFFPLQQTLEGSSFNHIIFLLGSEYQVWWSCAQVFSTLTSLWPRLSCLIILCLTSIFEKGIMPISKGIKYETYVKNLCSTVFGTL